MKNPAASVAIFTILFLAVGVVGYAYYFSTQFMATAPPHYVVESDQWPSPLQTLCRSTPALHESTRVFEFDAFVDTKSVWLISGHDEILAKFVADQSLETVTVTHPQYQNLLDFIPDDWPAINLAASKMYATKGYGSEHQEGIDLLFIVRDDSSDTTLVLHEWIF
jgi:hypothetical protein